MGKIFYGANETCIEVEDRLLAHIKVVIINKLRRDEKFTLSWVNALGDVPGRNTIWLHPAIEIRFGFDDPVRPALNREWIEALMRTANGGELDISTQLDPPA
ncbi:DUF7882 family protein [Subtercola frigoramans]|uniref:DUF7882 domain-containing protein n=1 Tax=Subtercola frigoramans TaxID=120298 RepID=A0ABS2L0N0_9MICO|nr:hypothetical protein [Subtercola frigoramans]MBM7470632.1 hypothetical protein [Subtercola frigoramans]